MKKILLLLLLLVLLLLLLLLVYHQGFGVGLLYWYSLGYSLER